MNNDNNTINLAPGQYYIDSEGQLKPERRKVPRTESGAIIMPAPSQPYNLKSDKAAS